ncbi:ATP-binding cassette domain-containing protein [Streptomyces apocyni]|uniref:ATP-binding cassette domain-containing protein n=1 Tax=Streptomyces apocyni TaxID=2654677 RepID=UPI0012E9E5B3|nr:ATP-binding cassette domain-containing protein [Streptomyces apocyni]
MTEPAVSAEGLSKKYGDFQALQDVNLSVPAGTVLGLLGPNGAGKTTTVRILATLLTPDAGQATVAGQDVLRKPAEVRKRIGLTGQYAAVDARLTGRENIELIGVLLHLGRKAAKVRAAELLEQFELTDAADKLAKNYSGGMRRRLDLAASLVSRPPVLFLDEPTTGLDLTSRMTLWRMVKEQVDSGVTVLLTTQYLEEADQLANRVAVIDKGRLIAEGTPDELKRRVGGDRLEVSVTDTSDLAVVTTALASLSAEQPTVDQDSRTASIALSGGIKAIASISAELEAAGVEPLDFAVRRSSMDDVFLALTGHSSAASDDGDPQQQDLNANEKEAQSV